MKRISGSYEILGNLKHFIPTPLPPSNPPLQLTDELVAQYGATMQQLGRLNEIAGQLPNIDRFIKAYVIKEALLSSAIEGIHTTLLDVFTQPLSMSKPNKETQLVLNYTKALTAALHLMQEENLPLASRVVLAAHEALMSIQGGDQANPGQYRSLSVRVGNLLPAPAPQIPKLMSDLEKYIHSNDELPPLIKTGLVHVQFETIHPFLDGNGRVGRLLIVLMLINSRLLSSPIIYPSFYFKKHHFEYYNRLNAVETAGDFEGWILFYLKAIEASSRDAYQRAKKIEHLAADIRVLNIHKLADQVIDYLFQFPVTSVDELAKALQKSYNTAKTIIQLFVDAKLLSLVEEQKRNKLYHFTPYLELLEQEFDDE